ncbi:group II intron maturase-specific domain-containing protein [Deltaproteobacteria bacterium TL4]
MKYDVAVELDHWLRSRIRRCYWKRWKRPRTRSRELLKLGVSKRQAILVGLSRKGYWKLSKTLSTNRGLTNHYLEKQGLVSIRQLWIKCHYPATAR